MGFPSQMATPVCRSSGMKAIGLTLMPSHPPIPPGLIWDGAVTGGIITRVSIGIGGIIDMANITKATAQVTRGATGRANTASITEGISGPAIIDIRIDAKSSGSIKKGPRDSLRALFPV